LRVFERLIRLELHLHEIIVEKLDYMEISRYWRLKDQFLRLEASNCGACKVVHFPPRRICPDCGHDNLKPVEVQKNVETPKTPETITASIDVFVSKADPS
jgi:hypothetical protein